MLKIEQEIHRIAASSEARLLETPYEKGLHLHLRFIERYPKLALKKATKLPIGRAAHNSKQTIGSFFDKVAKFFSEVKIAPQLLFNLDETSTVFSKSSEDVVVQSSSSVQPIIPEPSFPNST
eukprot:MONOS_13465.1-p1 / transcript=MONOS_13465.1 / gene=MONOS_13465 / organism=Monocercomonoides_exilis_PA203 / gene_product=unspecified product / transcript_product=unspecified product / location=Mono_scaffold00833:1741-2445(-) / protein_length=121 / sequence_SO=supercontig / SO=protein_coding / is_pseudo=false